MTRADARHLPFASGVAQCVVTSPPYWGLRDYGTAAWEGGDVGCDHFKLAGGTGAQNLGKSDVAMAANVERSSVAYRDVCGKCGARRIDRQIGLEPSPDAYVATLVAVFRNVWRVLKDDGVCFLNLGDSYFGDSPVRQSSAGAFSPTWDPTQTRSRGGSRRSAASVGGLKTKDLCGIPWRVAFALQADGWYLRSDIIWSKPNPMPESVVDRPTKSHEYVFLLTKQPRYYWDASAVREVGAGRLDLGRMTSPARLNQGGEWTRTEKDAADGRNIRSVWSIATQSYDGAHFATMPEKLVERCVLAGSRLGDLVLDPFLGSGTVALVAKQLGRRAAGCDLSRAYLDLAATRAHLDPRLPIEMSI